ncbi:MAG: hypothetical protein K0R98_1462 [Rickettsiaceae bacterium]|jgi:hypothetical protein|nr:hypothetical protein [Rickettsiaceae bacterium]
MFWPFKKNSNKETSTITKIDNSIIADKILNELIVRYKDERGVHTETLLSCLGALAGFGCQIAIRNGLIKTGQYTEDTAFVVVKTKDEEKYFFGDMLNQPLLEAKTSVWSMVAGAAQSVGSNKLPDICEIAQYVASSVGSDNFGKLRVIEEHQPQEQPIESLKKHWPSMYTQINSYNADQLFLGWHFGLAAQKLIVMTKDVLDPDLAVKIVMESAVAMAKIDPKIIGFTDYY